MNIFSFSTIGAIALTGMAFTFGTTSASAYGGSSKGGHSPSRGGNCHSPSRSHCSSRGRTCSHLPRGCRQTHYRGERCWYGGGNYYRCAPTGGYVCINEAPEVEYTTVVQRPCVKRRVVQQVVEQPVVEEQQEVQEQAVVEQPVVEEQEVETASYDSEEVVSYLPTNCETVYVGGTRCWYSNGCYYRHCGRGYTKFHCGDRGHVSRGCHTSRTSCHTSSHGSHGCYPSSHGRTCSTSRAHSSNRSHASSHGSSSHGSKGGHSSGHSHR